MMDLDDVMDVEIPDLPEFDMLEVPDGPHEESSSKVLEEWSKPESPLDDVVDEIMEIDVQMGEDLLDDKFFFNEDPCLSPTSALDDLVFSNTSLDDKELTLFAYPEEHEAPANPTPTEQSNIPTPPPSMSSFSKPKPVNVNSHPNAPVNTAPVPPPRGHAPVPRYPVPYVTPPPHHHHMAGRPPVPPPPYPHAHAPVRPPPAAATKSKPAARVTPPPATTTKSRSRPKQKKAPPKLNYIPAPPHMQPQPIAAAAAAAGAKRAAAAHAARIAAAAAAAASNKKAATTRKSASPARATPKKSTSPSTPTKTAPKTPATKKASPNLVSPPPSPPAFMKDEKYRSTLQKLTESMIRSQESRKCFQMKTPKTEKYARSKSVSKVLSSIEQSTRQIQTYLQGPAYGCGAISPPHHHHHNHPPSQPPAQPRNK